ncbi:MAG: hypothetical protein CL610_10455 [Anaerolineaceae bacterium]|nr:hypothetical protein [Anaerolineaceae bacterium]
MSIRWRLPLTYAAIALIAALVLGAVLLTTLRSYYAQQEWDYLHSNAIALQAIVNRLTDQRVPQATIDAQLNTMAFLSQLRVQLLDSDKNVLSDSGLPQDNILTVEGRAGIRVLTREAELTTTAAEGTTSQLWFYSPNGTERIDEQANHLPLLSPTQADPETIPQFDILIADGTTEAVQFAMPARRTLFGFNLNDTSDLHIGQFSDQAVELPVAFGSAGLSYLRLSQGPAYGLEILDGVARAWFVASVVAVILAALAGLYISQHISAPLLALTQVTSKMSVGDLSARAQINGKDEVGVLAHSFNDMANRVEETILTLRRFVADAAHELHTPLTALRTNIELIADEQQADEQQRFIDQALAQISRLESLTNDLLELSRLESNEDAPSLGRVNLSALVRETSEIYASQAEQKDINFHITLPAQDVFIPAHEHQLQHALTNMLENAIKFTPADGSILVALNEHNATEVELTVQDTGIGILDEDLPQLFSRFHRGRNAAAYPGSGLGLAIVRAIAQGHNGSITVRQCRPGTRFIFTLPIQPDSAPSDHALVQLDRAKSALI